MNFLLRIIHVLSLRRFSQIKSRPPCIFSVAVRTVNGLFILHLNSRKRVKSEIFRHKRIVQKNNIFYKIYCRKLHFVHFISNAVTTFQIILLLSNLPVKNNTKRDYDKIRIRDGIIRNILLFSTNSVLQNNLSNSEKIY